MGKNQWVSPHDGRWAVHGENNVKITKLFDTQEQAANYARSIAQNQQSEVIIQRPDGRIRSKTAMETIPAHLLIKSIKHSSE